MLFSMREFSNLEPPCPVDKSWASVLMPIKGDLFLAPGEIYVGLIPESAIFKKL